MPGTYINNGDLSSITSVQPVPLPPASEMTLRQVVAGDAFACALMNNTGADYVFCFGTGDSLPGGLAKQNAAAIFPVIIPLPSRSIRSIAAGSSTACVVFRDGAFSCFGSSNAYGELGTGDTTVVGQGMLPETVADLQRPGNQTSTIVTRCRPVQYSAVVTSIVPLNAPVTGNVLMSIRGTGLTSMPTLSVPIIFIGSQQCLVRTVTPSRIDCVVQAMPSTSGYSTYSVALAHPPAPDTPSYTFTYTYSDPQVVNVSGVPVKGLNTSGGDTLSVFGYNFGTLNSIVTDGYPPTITIQVALDRMSGSFVSSCGSAALVPTPQGQLERLDCIVSANGAGVNLGIALSTPAVPSQVWSLFQEGLIYFQPPVVNQIPSSRGSVDGGQVSA